MTRIATPATIADAPETSRPVLEAVAKQVGKAPNMVRSMAISPQALEGHLGLFASRGKEALPGGTRERIALAVAEVNGCSYAAAVKIAGYSDAQIIEIVQHVGLNTWTNYFNEVFQIDIDFPVVEARMAA